MIRYRPNRRRYFITTGATYELLRQAAAGASGLIPSLQLTASSSGKLLVSLVDDVANQPAVVAALTPLLAEGAVQEVTEVEWNAAVANASSGGVSSWNDLTDKPSTFTPTDGSVTDAKIATAGLSESVIAWQEVQPWQANVPYSKGALVESSGLLYRALVPQNTATLVTNNWVVVSVTSVNATRITTGTLNAARLPTTGVSASSLTTGTLANARMTTRARASMNLYLWSSFR